MFQFENVPMEKTVEDELPKFTVHPDNLYPAVIARIQECLGGAPADELHESKYLVTMAKQVPVEAWADALLPRDQFIGVDFSSFVQDGKPHEELLNMVAVEFRGDVLRMVQRGLALEVARKWFTRSLGYEFGRCNLHITTGINDDKAFRL
jgi:hypothetical protein